MGNVTPLKSSNAEAVRYVWATDRDHRGNVRFQFSIGDPSLYLEVILPPAAFDDFCREHQVRVLSGEEGAQVDAKEWRWHYKHSCSISERGGDGICLR